VRGTGDRLKPIRELDKKCGSTATVWSAKFRTVPTYSLRVSFQRVLIIIVDIGIEDEYDGLFCCSGAMC